MSEINHNMTKCPNDEILVNFVEHELGGETALEVASHILLCDRCARRAKAMAECGLARTLAESGEVSDEIRKIVDRAWEDAKGKIVMEKWQEVSKAFWVRREVLAAADGQSADQLQQKSAVDSGFFYFYSHGLEDDKDPNAWRVRMARPPSGGVSEEYVLRLHIESLSGEPIGSGVLTFCGVKLPVKRGVALMPLKTFLENIRNAMISLRRESGEDIPGMLVFK